MRGIRKLGVLVLVTLSCAVQARAQGEPNDDCGGADLLGPGLWSDLYTFEYDDFPWPDVTDFDYYGIAVPAHHYVRVWSLVQQVYGTGELQLRFAPGGCVGNGSPDWTNNGQTIALNSHDQTWPYSLLARAWYYNNQVDIIYAIGVEFYSPGCVGATDDRFEAGPEPTLVPIAPGVHSGLFARSSDPDTYSLRLPQGTTVRVQIDFSHFAGDLDLAVGDSGGNATSNGVTDVETVTFTTSDPIDLGFTQIHVAPKAGLPWVCNTYTLSIDVLQTPLGTSYCQAGVNGYTTEARILANGSSSVSANSLSFWCQAFPGMNSGVLAGSPLQAQVPFGDGYRCVGPGTVRLASSAATNHVAVYPLNLAVGPGLAITPGTTWNFQVVYRDLTLPGGAGFNATDGVSIAMTP